MKRIKFALALTAALAALTISTAFSQPVTGRLVPYGFCTLSSMSSSTGLASCANVVSGAVILANVQYAVICAETQAVNWRDDGTAPTGTVGSGGMGIPAGSCIPYNGTFSQIRFIQQSGGAVLSVSFYR